MNGLELSERFYQEVVEPLLGEHFPGLVHSAALIGPGSEVLGFDTEMSRDHDWGPRFQLFLREEDLDRLGSEIDVLFRKHLPRTFQGFPTSFAANGDGTSHAEGANGNFVAHKIEVTTAARFLTAYLGIENVDDLKPIDWLLIPQQELRSIVAGRVFHDSLGLEGVRKRFEYFPRDVWLFLLASAWERIGQEEHLVGRAGYVGDELGARIIASRLVRDLMRLAFLFERQYAPYPKWFGTAFSQLECAPHLEPLLTAALDARGWEERDLRLVPAYEFVAALHNASGLTEPLPDKVGRFFGRPFHIIHLTGNYATALRQQIQDPEMVEIASRRNIGGLDMFSDCTDLVSHTEWRTKLRSLYR